MKIEDQEFISKIRNKKIITCPYIFTYLGYKILIEDTRKVYLHKYMASCHELQVRGICFYNDDINWVIRKCKEYVRERICSFGLNKE